MNYECLNDIATKYETPTYVFFEDVLFSVVSQLRNNLPDKVKLCFAMKANPFLVGSLAKVVDRLEVCSPGEYEICIREKIAPEKIVVSGVNKTEEAINRILSYSNGEGIYTIESPKHFEVLKKCAEKAGITMKVLLRLSSKNQFGMDKEALEEVLGRVLAEKRLSFVGIHYYSGTQKKTDKVEKELKMLDEYGSLLKEKFAIDNMELEYGPGLGISYFEGEGPLEPDFDEKEKQLKTVGDMLENLKEYTGISIELGRFLTSDCGVFLTRIMDIKKNYDMGYMIVDGGIHQLNYYGQLMGMKIPHIKLIKMSDLACDETITKWTICGSLCTVNDVLVRGVRNEDYSEGDVLAFFKCGAYSVTEGMALFLSRELPSVVLVKADGSIEHMRDKIEINELNGKKSLA